MLKGKTALVTGAGRGIGKAIAARLAAEGATVFVNYSRSIDGAQAVVDDIEKVGGRAFAVKADVADLDSIDAMFETVRQHASSLDILVNNAGRGSNGMPSLDQSTPEDFEAMFGLNTRGLFFVTQAAARMMADGGRIVNLGSSASHARVAGLSIYAASKAAVEAFTRVWSIELARRGITVNTVLPGIVDTDLISAMPDNIRERSAAAVPMGRMGQPADIADVVAFLCGDGARWISGQDIVVSGGA